MDANKLIEAHEHAAKTTIPWVGWTDGFGRKHTTRVLAAFAHDGRECMVTTHPVTGEFVVMTDRQFDFVFYENKPDT